LDKLYHHVGKDVLFFFISHFPKIGQHPLFRVFRIDVFR